MVKKHIFYLLLLSSLVILPSIANALESVSFTSTISGVVNKANNTYKYSITPSEDNLGVVTNYPSEIEIVFNDIDVENNRVTGNATIDFSSAIFQKHTVYEFILKEISSTDERTYPIDNTTYKLRMEYSSSGKLTVLGVGISSKTNQKENITFNHTANLTSINIISKVQGDMADQDKNIYFRYRLHIEGNPGDKYTILGMDKEVTIDGKKITIPTEYIIPSDPTSSDNYVELYLRHGQTVSVGLSKKGLSQIPVGTKFSVSKYGNRGWKTFINERETTTSNDIYASDVAGDNTIVIINERDFDVPVTGLFVDILPFVLLIILAIVIFIVFKKVNKDDEEDE